MISRNYVVRAGLVTLVAGLSNALVVPENAEGVDLLIYDLDAALVTQKYGPARDEFKELSASGVPMIGVVYENGRAWGKPSGSVRMMTLSTTPLELSLLIKDMKVQPTVMSVNVKSFPQGLTPRELEVLRMIGAGHSNSYIAQTLYVSPNTVKTYVREAYRKIGVRSRTQAVRWAVKHGLVASHDSEAVPS